MIEPSKAELVDIDGDVWHVISDEQSCCECYYPPDGEGSLEDLVARFGCEDDALILQSAHHYYPIA